MRKVLERSVQSEIPPKKLLLTAAYAEELRYMAERQKKRNSTHQIKRTAAGILILLVIAVVCILASYWTR